MSKSTFQISGIHCESCTKLIQRRLSKLEGVSETNVSEDGLAEVSANREIGKEEVKTALADTDYKVL